MRIAEAAWHDVDTTTICNCWQKAGILPDAAPPPSHTNHPSIPISTLLHDTSKSSHLDPITQVEKQVEAVLDDLVATGALQKGNRMDIESLLNPAGESHILTETSDEEIYQAVIDAKEAHENLEGDDIDECPLSEPRPTHRDLLKAVSTINKYIEEVNDPLARRIEALLGTLNRHIRVDEARNMKETLLTDYFQRA